MYVSQSLPPLSCVYRTWHLASTNSTYLRLRQDFQTLESRLQDFKSLDSHRPPTEIAKSSIYWTYRTSNFTWPLSHVFSIYWRLTGMILILLLLMILTTNTTDTVLQILMILIPYHDLIQSKHGNQAFPQSCWSWFVLLWVCNSDWWGIRITDHFGLIITSPQFPTNRTIQSFYPFDISRPSGSWRGTMRGKTEKRAEVADVKKKKTLFAKREYKTPAQRFEKNRTLVVTLRYRLQSYRLQTEMTDDRRPRWTR